ncbi:low temperature requirement protein A [Nostocales cyanobacterium HT-58-2]|nr:low temperature requirement protein A [Nostocales cyanobacterium HT-58-2]
MKKWLKPPKLRIDENSEAERHATWLELFYDLIFVVTIARLNHNLSHDISLSGFFCFVVLFVPVWWTWVGAVLYATRFDTDDLGHRLLTAIQIVAVAALAVNVHNGLGENSAGFALSYAAVRIVLVIEYLYARWHVPATRALTTRFAWGFGTAAAIWLISAFVPQPLRFMLWALGLMLDFATPLRAGKLDAEFAPHSSHLPERFGLFTLIVLGESIIAVVSGVAEQTWNISTAIAAVSSLIIVFSLWWVYFDNLGGSAIQAARACRCITAYQIWLYTHLPLVIGIAAIGVGVKYAILSQPSMALPPAVRWLVCTTLAICLLALGMIYLSSFIGLNTLSVQSCPSRVKYRAIAAAFVFALAVAGADLSPVGLIGLLAVICAAQIIFEACETTASS